MNERQYRLRAELALGRKLKRTEHVHHHSETQLVICDAKYHRWLHKAMRERGIPNPELNWRNNVVLRLDRKLLRRVDRFAELDGRSRSKVLRVVIELGIRRFPAWAIAHGATWVRS